MLKMPSINDLQSETSIKLLNQLYFQVYPLNYHQNLRNQRNPRAKYASTISSYGEQQ